MEPVGIAPTVNTLQNTVLRFDASTCPPCLPGLLLTSRFAGTGGTETPTNLTCRSCVSLSTPRFQMPVSPGCHGFPIRGWVTPATARVRYFRSDRPARGRLSPAVGVSVGWAGLEPATATGSTPSRSVRRPRPGACFTSADVSACLIQFGHLPKNAFNQSVDPTAVCLFQMARQSRRGSPWPFAAKCCVSPQMICKRR